MSDFVQERERQGWGTGAQRPGQDQEFHVNKPFQGDDKLRLAMRAKGSTPYGVLAGPRTARPSFFRF